MQYRICRHIKTTGLQCQSPAVGETLYCYFHTHLFQRHQAFHFNDATRGYLIPGQHVELAPLEDRESVQVAISVIVNALATGQLETRRGYAILYGLQLAGNHVALMNTHPYAPNVALTVESSPEGRPLAEPGNYVEVLDEEQLRAEERQGDDDDDDDEDDEDDTDADLKK